MTYQVFICTSPYDSFTESDEVRSLLSATWKMKLDGYKNYFPYGIMPIDHLDFIANHVIVCKNINGRYIPVSGFKSVTVAQCERFNIPFPIKGHMLKGTEDSSELFVAGIEQWLKNKNKAETAYNFGFTIEPSLPSQDKKELIQLMASMLYFYYTSSKIPNIIHAVTNTFKLAQEQEAFGFKKMTIMGQELPPLKSHNFNGYEYYFMTIDNMLFKSEFVEKSNREHLSLWEKRITYSEEKTNVERAKTAA